MRPPANPNTQLHRFLKDGIYKALTSQPTLPYHLRTTIDGDTPTQPIDLTSPPLSPSPGQGSTERVDSAEVNEQRCHSESQTDDGHQLVPDISRNDTPKELVKERLLSPNESKSKDS